MKILIVEDHADLRRLMKLALGGEHHTLIEATDAVAGWQAAQLHRPDVALLDIMVPGPLDGLELCRHIKDDPRTRHAKVVLVSGRGHRNDVLIGQAAGADDYLVKPFSPKRLAEIVSELMAA
ncbi:MAG: hypothetical protein RIQ60_1564 [Pseudomonadota bacterium]